MDFHQFFMVFSWFRWISRWFLLQGCKSKNFMECFSPLESKISAEYNVGGGVTDKEEAPHSPEVALTVPRKEGLASRN